MFRAMLMVIAFLLVSPMYASESIIDDTAQPSYLELFHDTSNAQAPDIRTVCICAWDEDHYFVYAKLAGEKVVSEERRIFRDSAACDYYKADRIAQGVCPAE